MSDQRPGGPDLFHDDLVAAHLAVPGRVARQWLVDDVEARVADPAHRVVLVTGEPGAGKSDLAAGLAARHPDWLRVFIRRDSVTALSGGDAVSTLLRAGHQLAARRPELFDPAVLEVVVDQRVDVARAGSSVVGIRIEDLAVSPFHRTALRVQQHVGDLAGALTGVEIAHATVEPRLLAPETLQYLALLDPAAALHTIDPTARVVLLVDALDEAPSGSLTTTVVDWLVASPELPPNVTILLTSRPHAGLARLRHAFRERLDELDIATDRPEVRRDVAEFVEPLIAELGAAPGGHRGDAAALVERADGNFAYLNAYARAARGARASGDAELLELLLRLDRLPSDLPGLYAFFLLRVRREVELLGRFEPDDDTPGPSVPAWEGVGAPFLAVLAVALAPVSLTELRHLGGVRAYAADAGAVLERFRPFLDEVDGRWHLFHGSVAEALTSPLQPMPELAVDAQEWHRRIVRRYRGGAASWDDVAWGDVDDYGVLHLPGHLAACGEAGRTQLLDLVSPGYRAASRRVTGTDLGFLRLTDAAGAAVPGASPVVALPDQVFLAVVRHAVRSVDVVAPGVLGLMARTGSVPAALSRAETIAPGLWQFRSLEAVRECTPPALRGLLGDGDGVERLVSAAEDVPRSGDIFGSVRHDECVTDAACLVAPADLARALELVSTVDPRSRESSETKVRLASAAAVGAVGGLARLRRIGVAAVDTLLDLAERAGGGERTAFAQVAAELSSQNAEATLDVLARIAVLLPAMGGAEGEARRWLLDLIRTRADEPLEKDYGPASPDDRGAAAARLAAEEPDVARRLVESYWPVAVDTGNDLAFHAAGEVWGRLGRPDLMEEAVERLLTHYRALGWYGPARDIASLAVTIDAFDPGRAQELADLAMDMLRREVERGVDAFEVSRLDGIIGGVVRAFATWDRPRALAAARWMHGTWIPGESWRSLSAGRQSALAALGLTVVDEDPALARALLAECEQREAGRRALGRSDPAVLSGTAFTLDPPGAPDQSRQVNFATYVQNVATYWSEGREAELFERPAEVLESASMAPQDRAFTGSWAAVAAAAVDALADTETDAAAALAARVVDPLHRLVADAALLAAFVGLGREEATDLAELVERDLEALPHYRPEVPLDDHPQGRVISALDPSARARFAAALLLPEDARWRDVLREDSPYAGLTALAELGLRWLEAADTETLTADEVMSTLEMLDGYPDALQLDIVRAEAVRRLEDLGDARAEEVFGRIGTVHLRRLLVLERLAVAGVTDEESWWDAIRVGEDRIAPSQVLRLAARAAALARNAGPPGLADQIVDVCRRESAQLALHDQISVLLDLADGSEPGDAAGLVLDAMNLSRGPGNPYRVAVAVARALAIAITTGNVLLVGKVVERLVSLDWSVLMNALRDAMWLLAEEGGGDVVARLEARLLRAQVVVDGAAVADGSIRHLDGVGHPGEDPRPVG